MNKDEILIQLQKIVQDVLELENVELTSESTASEVNGWDSIMHVEIIVAIEDEFNVNFKTFEIEKFKTVGDIINGILDNA